MSDLYHSIQHDIEDYEAACFVFGVKYDEDDVYSKKGQSLVKSLYETKYNNIRIAYLRNLPELPIKRPKQSRK